MKKSLVLSVAMLTFFIGSAWAVDQTVCAPEASITLHPNGSVDTCNLRIQYEKAD